MSEGFGVEQARRATIEAGAASTGVMVLTIVHHAYGAAIYPAAFRGHVALIGIPVTLAIIAATMLSIRPGWPAQLARRAAIILMTLVPVLGVGLYEGLYNHVLKNAVYVVGLYDQLGGSLFPATLYERPDDWLFEISGMAQFLAAMFAATRIWRVIKLDARWEKSILRPQD